MKKYSKYTIRGIEVPGVTTVLSVLAKDGLNEWYGRLGIKEAVRQRDAAAEFGSKVHDLIEAFYTDKPYDEPTEERVKAAFESFKIWAKSNVKRFFAFEKAIFHDELMYAGTLDIVAELPNGKIIIIDIKTSKAVREEYFLQVCAYKNATRIEENCIDLDSITGAIIVHLDHKTLTWSATNVNLTEKLFETWKACVTLYKWKHGIS